jgi:hypothetical protein
MSYSKTPTQEQGKGNLQASGKRNSLDSSYEAGLRSANPDGERRFQ